MADDATSSWVGDDRAGGAYIGAPQAARPPGSGRTGLLVVLPLLVLVLLGLLPPAVHAYALDNTQTLHQEVGPYELERLADGSWYREEGDELVASIRLPSGSVLEERFSLASDDPDHPSAVLDVVRTSGTGPSARAELVQSTCATWPISIGPWVHSEEAHRTLVRPGSYPDIPEVRNSDADRDLRPLCVDRITIKVPAD